MFHIYLHWSFYSEVVTLLSRQSIPNCYVHLTIQFLTGDIIQFHRVIDELRILSFAAIRTAFFGKSDRGGEKSSISVSALSKHAEIGKFALFVTSIPN